MATATAMPREKAREKRARSEGGRRWRRKRTSEGLSSVASSEEGELRGARRSAWLAGRVEGSKKRDEGWRLRTRSVVFGRERETHAWRAVGGARGGGVAPNLDQVHLDLFSPRPPANLPHLPLPPFSPSPSMGKSQQTKRKQDRRAGRHNPVRVPDAHLGQGADSAKAHPAKEQALLPIIDKVGPQISCGPMEGDAIWLNNYSLPTSSLPPMPPTACGRARPCPT